MSELICECGHLQNTHMTGYCYHPVEKKWKRGLGCSCRLSPEAIQYKAERDALQRKLDEAKGIMVDIEDYFKDGDGRECINASGDELVEALCERLGYGFVMDASARLWSRKDPIGSFFCGFCNGLLKKIRQRMKEALKEQEA